MNRGGRMEIKNGDVIQDEDINIKNQRRNAVLSKYQMKQVDVQWYLYRMGWLLDENNEVNGEKSKSNPLIVSIQVLTQLFQWTWIFRSSFLLLIDNDSEWNYLLGDFTPAFGKKNILQRL